VWSGLILDFEGDRFVVGYCESFGGLNVNFCWRNPPWWPDEWFDGFCFLGEEWLELLKEVLER
jgi:hypothetical protein